MTDNRPPLTARDVPIAALCYAIVAAIYELIINAPQIVRATEFLR